MGNKKIESDAFGNNVAFKCPECGYPVIAVLVNKGARGTVPNNPSICRGCSAEYLILPNDWEIAINLSLKKLK